MRLFSRRKKENRFLELLAKQAEFTVEGMEALKLYMKGPDKKIAEQVSKIESEADEVRRNPIRSRGYIRPVVDY
jgi:uncharacterized protein Yka (UPF0111/DUF47 family)